MVVCKPGKEGLRFNAELRPVNVQTNDALYPVPNAEPIKTKLTGSKHWFNLDFLRGY